MTQARDQASDRCPDMTADKVRAAPAPDTWLAEASVRRDLPLSPQVYALLRRVIVEGRLEPGSALREPALAAHLRVSRTPVREAFLRLQQDGLLDLRPQSGTFVTSIDRTRVEEGMIVREALEVRAAAIAAEKISEPELTILRQETDKMADAARNGDNRSFIEADDRFHRTLVDASAYTHIGMIIDQVNAQLDRIRYLSANVPERPEASIVEHNQLIKRLAARDANGSAEALRAHLTASWAIIGRLMQTP